MSGYDFGGKGGGSSSGYNFPSTDAFVTKHKSKTHRKASHPHGVGGFFGNLIDDVKDTALGLPMGVISAFEHPIRHIEQAAHAEWANWSPLFHGDVSKFAHNFYDHPLAPLLDVAAVFTGGAALAGKAGFALGASGAISKESALFKLGEQVKMPHSPYKMNAETMKWERQANVPTMIKETRSNPIHKAFQLKKHEIMDAIAGENPKWFFSPDSPVVGANTRYRKLERKRVWSKHAGMTTNTVAVIQAAKELEKEGKAADIVRGALIHGTYKGMLRHAIRMDPSAVKNGLGTTFRGKHGGGQYSFVVAADKVQHLLDKGIAHDKFEGTFKNVGSLFTTRHFSEAARHEDGSVLVAAHHTKEMLNLIGKEGASASSAMKYLYHKPTQVWKFMVLGLRPAFLVNNAVGNYFMYTMSQGGSHATRGYIDALRNVWGDYRMSKDMTKSEKWLHRMNDPNNIIDRHFLDQTTNSFADSSYGLPDGEGGIKARIDHLSKGEGKMRHLRYGLYPITHAVSDRFLRKATIYAIGRSTREVKLMRKANPGMSFEHAFDKVLTENPHIRDRISEKVNDSLGDYHNLNKVEQVMRQIVPFYTWDRAIMRHGGNMLADRPIRTAFMANLGRQGTAQTEELLGKIPHFLKGAVPLGALGIDHVPGIPDSAKRVPILTTQGLNPYASLADIGTAVGVAGFGKKEPNPGEALSTINPIVSGTISFFTGRDIVTGKQVEKHGNPLSTALVNIGRGLPQVRLASAALPEQGFGWDLIRKAMGEKQHGSYKVKGEKGTRQALYSQSWEEIAAAYLGIPIKEYSPSAGKKRAGDEAKAMTF